jgi:acetyl-CoA acetyltransferase
MPAPPAWWWPRTSWPNWAGTDGLVPQLGRGGLRPFAHGHRPGAGGGKAVRPHRPWLDDIDLVELNEAFAPQVLACLKGWGWSDDDSRNDMLNVNGSGISLGHPIGATGAHPGQPAARTAAPRRALWAGNDVHRRRAGLAAVFERA